MTRKADLRQPTSGRVGTARNGTVDSLANSSARLAASFPLEVFYDSGPYNLTVASILYARGCDENNAVTVSMGPYDVSFTARVSAL